MNFIEASVAEFAEGQALLDTAGLGQIKAATSAGFVQKGAEIIAAIRPEKLALSDQQHPGSQNSVQGFIETATYLGDRSHFYVSVEGCSKPVAVAAQDVQISST